MIIIMVIALIVFGPRKLPEIGRQIGLAMRELNKMRGDMQRAFNIDELTNFDSTPSYHPAPYGTTYPANGDVSHSLDAYHPSTPETVYHNDPVHDEAGGGLLESVSVSDSPTLTGASVATPNGESPLIAPPPGPPLLRGILAEKAAADAHPASLPTDIPLVAESAVQ